MTEHNHPREAGKWITQDQWNQLQAEATAMREALVGVLKRHSEREVEDSKPGKRMFWECPCDACETARKALSSEAGKALLAELEQAKQEWDKWEEAALKWEEKLLTGELVSKQENELLRDALERIAKSVCLYPGLSWLGTIARKVLEGSHD